MVNALKLIKEIYEKTSQKIDVSNCCLEGELKLKDFTKLKTLDCRDNNITSLDVSKCSQLTEL
jgi:Leucine-rich repeat (LRR) protein